MTSSLTRTYRVGATSEAATYFRNSDIQDRTRRVFAGMSPIEQRINHKRAEWFAASEEWRTAWDTPDEAHWNRTMDTLNAEIEDLEAQQRAGRVQGLEAA